MSCTKGPDLCYIRADTAALTLIFNRSAAPVDLSGWTDFRLTVDEREEPDDASTQEFQMDGTFSTDGTDGSIDFFPQGADEPSRRISSEAYTVGEFFYDVQAIDGTGARVTLLLAGNFAVKQDINKG